MKEWSVIVDSSCGETKEFVEKNGGFFVPYIIEYDGKEYLDGVDIKYKDVMKKIDDGIIGKTAVPSIPSIQKVYDAALKTSKNAIVISLSKELSGINNAFIQAKKEDKYKNIHVVKSNFHTPWIPEMFRTLTTGKGTKWNFKQVVDFVEDWNKNLFAILSLKDVKFLAASGRIPKSKAKFGTLLGIQPTLVYSDGIVDEEKSLKPRNSKKAIKMSIDVMNEYIESKKLDRNDWFISLMSVQKEQNFETVKELINEYTDLEVRKTQQNELIGVSLVHVGYDITIFFLQKKIK